jgi:hypothetical protein
VADEEIIARVVTAPNHYNLVATELLTSRLTALYSSGLSVIRQGASDAEIRSTVLELLSVYEPQSLVGVIIVQAQQIRQFGEGGRQFCVYDTKEGTKRHHADVFGTIPRVQSKTQVRRIADDRRYGLRDLLARHLRVANSIDEVISAIRAAST